MAFKAQQAVPKTLTSSGAKRGLFTRQDFIYDAKHDHTPARRAQNSPKFIAARITRKTSTATAT